MGEGIIAVTFVYVNKQVLEELSSCVTVDLIVSTYQCLSKSKLNVYHEQYVSYFVDLVCLQVAIS